MLRQIKAITSYRQFLLSSIKRDLIHRFAASKLGGLWSILNPLTQVLIYALILSNVLHSKLGSHVGKYDYAVYLMAGMLAWNLFSDILGRCTELFVANANLLKKVAFPRILLPLTVVGSSAVNNLILLTVMFIIFAILGHPFSSTLLWLPLLMMYTIVFSAVLGVMLGVLNVFLRDLGQVIPIVLQVLFWFTPIVYPINIIPTKYVAFLSLNPMFELVSAYHDVVFYGRAPQHVQFLEFFPFFLGVLFLFVLFLFRRAGPEMVDVL